MGTIAFTAKVSGVPDLVLQLNAPGGILNTISLPVFHPCVRLGRWKEKPGELSFVPPDGRFVLAGYEADLLGGDYLSTFSTTSKSVSNLNLPATAEVRVSLGPTGAEFEVRLIISPRFQNKPASSSSSSSGFGRAASAGLGSRSVSAFSATGTKAHPQIEEVKVHIPLPATVRTVADLRVSRGDAQYAPGDAGIEWRVAGKDVHAMMASSHGGSIGAVATLRGTVVGEDEEEEETAPAVSLETGRRWQYDEDEDGGYQTSSVEPVRNGNEGDKEEEQRNKRQVALNRVLMPSCATVSFSVKGWLVSGIRVDSLMVDAKRSKGLGAGVTPYKGVKYLTVSKKGVEVRC
jgi:hypothetical protein